ncbi:MAG: VOC family protein [Acidimicrobiales bacterium]
MTITLDHTIVPSHDKDTSARWLADVFGLPYDGAGYFAPVQVNAALTLDFADADDVPSLHYAFVVDDDDFDRIFEKIQATATNYGSGPGSSDDGQINHRRGGRGVYFVGGPDPHLWEIMTTPETGT